MGTRQRTKTRKLTVSGNRSRLFGTSFVESECILARPAAFHLRIESRRSICESDPEQTGPDARDTTVGFTRSRTTLTGRVSHSRITLPLDERPKETKRRSRRSKIDRVTDSSYASTHVFVAATDVSWMFSFSCMEICELPALPPSSASATEVCCSFTFSCVTNWCCSIAALAS